MKIKKFFVDGNLVALVISKGINVRSSTFFSPPKLNFQVGILKRPAGFIEEPHYHKHIKRKINRVEQFLYLLEGKMLLEFFDKKQRLAEAVRISKGDGVLIIDGTHSIKIIKDTEAISIKQGPFLGDKMDKVEVKIIP